MKLKYIREYKKSTISLVKELRDICAEANQIPTFLAFDPLYRDRVMANVLARQMFCSILHSAKINGKLNLNLQDIGILVYYPDISNAFDHSLVLHSISTVENLVETNAIIKKNYNIAADKFNMLLKGVTKSALIKAKNVDHWIKLSGLKDLRLKINRQYIVT